MIKNLCNVAGTVYFTLHTLQEHEMCPRVLTDDPSHHEAWDGACVLGTNALRKMTLIRSTSYTCMPSLAYRQNLLSSLKTTEHYSTLQASLSWLQSSNAWPCHGVSGSLVRSTCDLQADGDPWWHSLDFFPVCCSGSHRCLHSVSVLCGHPNPGLWECSIDQCCWMQWHTTNTLCPTCAAIRQYVHPASHRPTLQLLSNGWSC